MLTFSQSSIFQSTIATSTFDTNSTLRSPQVASISASHRCSIEVSAYGRRSFKNLTAFWMESPSICVARTTALFGVLCSEWCGSAGPPFQADVSTA